jgi:putative transferase (TIGR04331 family)
VSNYFLITTSLEETWNTDKKIFFLGEWCKQIHRKAFWNKLNSKTQTYHWNNREKLKKDYNYSKSLYNNLISELTKNLNFYHKVNYSSRYWKIVLGPWLLSFIQVVLERYENIEQLEGDENEYETIILKIDKNILLPTDYEMYSRLIMSDTWNHFIFSEIIKNLKNQRKISFKEKEFKDRENFRGYLKIKHYSKIRKIYSLFTSIFKKKIKKEKFLISESYLGFFSELILNLKLGCFPKFDNFKLPEEKIINDEERKEYLLKDFSPRNEFEKILCNLIKIQIPISYFENFEKIQKIISNINWPEQPKIIFTSHFLQKTIQAVYTAEKVEKFDAKLIHGQHGGAYGQYLFSTLQDYEIDVCDKFLSWGWPNLKNKKVVPFGIIKNISKIKYNKKNNKILLILRSQSRYTHRINSYSGSYQLHNYFKECVQFCKKIDNVMQTNQLIVRLHARRFWDEGLLFKNEFPKLNIDEGYKSIHELVSNSKLVVHSYVGTGYLETLTSNFPTIVFTNVSDCLLSQDTIDDLKILSEAKIFHPNYESAADFIKKNHQNIDDWWKDDITQKARSFFCKKYANKNKNKINNLVKILGDY